MGLKINTKPRLELVQRQVWYITGYRHLRNYYKSDLYLELC